MGALQVFFSENSDQISKLNALYSAYDQQHQATSNEFGPEDAEFAESQFPKYQSFLRGAFFKLSSSLASTRETEEDGNRSEKKKIANHPAAAAAAAAPPPPPPPPPPPNPKIANEFFYRLVLQSDVSSSSSRGQSFSRPPIEGISRSSCTFHEIKRLQGICNELRERQEHSLSEINQALLASFGYQDEEIQSQGKPSEQSKSSKSSSSSSSRMVVILKMQEN